MVKYGVVVVDVLFTDYIRTLKHTQHAKKKIWVDMCVVYDMCTSGKHHASSRNTHTEQCHLNAIRLPLLQ